jgi:hypothetical protein
MAPDGILSGGLDSVSREAGRPSIYGFEFAHLSNCGVDFCELSAAVSGLSVVTGSAAQAARFLNHAGRLFSASHAKRPGTPVGQATRIFTAGGVVWRHGRWVGVIAASGEKESALLTLARKQLSRLMQRER